MAEIEVPPYFLCPITLDIMRDPVTISTGITYDRESIEKWIFTQKNNVCPVTKQALSVDDTDHLIPNITLRRLIQSWCTLHASHGIERLPTPKPQVSKPELLKLLNDVKTNTKTRIQSLQALRSIASQNQTNKRCMEKVGVHEFLATLIVENTLHDEAISKDLLETRKACGEALTILHNLQLSESGLKTLANDDEFLESLTRAMECASYESRAYIVTLLKSILEVADPAGLMTLRPELFVELVHNLNDQICQKGSKATLKVLITACPWGRNRIKAVEAGAVQVLVDILLESSDKRTCEMTLMVLDFLCQCADGRAELIQHSAGLAIVSKKILRVSQVATERAIRILLSVSRFSATPRVSQEMMQTGVVAKLCLVLQVDCGSKMKERAREMLKLHARTWRNSSCMPTNFVSSYPSN